MAKDDSEKRYIGDYGEPAPAAGKAALTLAMVILALAVGFVVGAVVWALMWAASTLTGLIWEDAYALAGVPWYPVAVCAVGGLAIGLWERLSKSSLQSLEEVIAQLKRDGTYRMPGGFAKGVVSFLLPLAFGGSVGPEAGLAGVITGACVWIGKTLKRAGLAAKGVADATLAATLSAVFGTPLIGMAATAREGLPDESGYTFRAPAKLVLYAAAAFGALGGMRLFGFLLGRDGGLSRFDAIGELGADAAWIVVAIAVGYLLACVYGVADRAFARLGGALSRHVVARAAMGGVVLGACGAILPFSMFSGEEQMTQLMGQWGAWGAVALIATGALKAALTPWCIRMGWRGGHFFPLIFAGVSAGFGLAALTGADGVFCAMSVSTSLMAAVMRRPLVALALLLLCFPASGIVWMGIAAVVAAYLPMPPFARPVRRSRSTRSNGETH